MHRRLVVEPHRQSLCLVSLHLRISASLAFGDLVSDRLQEVVRCCIGVGTGESHREFGHSRFARRERDVRKVGGSALDRSGKLRVGAEVPSVQGRLGFCFGDVGLDGSCAFA